jgi:hypothetical protein
MKKISTLTDRDLKWSQPSARKMEYELRAGDELVATLRFRSSFGSFATAESADGCWTFKRVGFWRTRVTIRACNTDTEIAVFRNNTWKKGGTLEYPDGRAFRADSNLWLTKFGFTTASKEQLLEFRNSGVVHLSATVHIRPAAAGVPELPWMVMLGWYLAIMMRSDANTAGAAATG